MNQNFTLAWSLGRFVYFDEHTYTRCVHETITNEDKHDHKLLSKLENYTARDEWALTSLFVMIISICQNLHQRWQQQLNGTSITSGADHQRSTGADDPPSTTNDQRYRFCRQNRMEWMKLAIIICFLKWFGRYFRSRNSVARFRSRSICVTVKIGFRRTVRCVSIANI